MSNSTLSKSQQKSLIRKTKKLDRLSGQISILAEKIAGDKNPAGLRSIRRAEKIIKIARQIDGIKEQIKLNSKRKRGRKSKLTTEARRIVKLAEMSGKAMQKTSRLASQIIDEASGSHTVAKIGSKKIPANNGTAKDSDLPVQAGSFAKVDDPANACRLQQGKQEIDSRLVRPTVADRQEKIIPRRGFRANNSPSKLPVKKDMRNCWTVVQRDDEWSDAEAKLMRNRLNGCTGFFIDSVNPKMRKFLFLRGGKWEKDVLGTVNGGKEIDTVVHYDSINSMEYSSRIVSNLAAIGPRA